MSQDKELEIRRQFLDEAQAYLDSLDAALIGLANHRVDVQKINAALRAAHSIKGGAGMMGFPVLSDLAHRLEDAFKVLKIQGSSLEITSQLENQLLAAVNVLRRVITLDRQGTAIDTHWLNADVLPIFEEIHDRLGDPQSEDAATILSPEDDGQNILPMLFETEVDGCLQRLEGVLAHPDQPCLREEVLILAQELGGLGEMLQLSAFSRLCESVLYSLEAEPDDAETIAQQALRAWRRTQALVVAGQLDLLPTTIEHPAAAGAATAVAAAPVEPQWEEVFQPTWDTSNSSEELEPPLTAAYSEVLVDDEGVRTIDEVATPQPAAASARRGRETQVSDFKVLDERVEVEAPAIEDSDATVRVPVRQLNQLNDLFGELAIERNGLDLYLRRLRSLSQLLSQRVQNLEQSNAQMRTAYDKVTPQVEEDALIKVGVNGTHSYNGNGNGTHDSSSTFDALEMDRYNELHSLSQQVMETIVQIQEVSSDLDLSLDDAEQNARDLNKTAKRLQTNLNQLRMRPLADVVDRFPRALRELSLQYGKRVKLVVHGGNTLIDRNILESLNDPLMHLLRNAFDHGIEDPDSRHAKGKSEEGVIEISASHRANRTLITIRDDGNGIPLDKVRSRAEQMGLDSSLLAAASDQDLLSLIFEPGFSTSDQVTALSGRGVGLDVVRDNLKQVRGDISVDTEAGVGTTFTLSVPFTLSVVRVLLVESNGMLLVLPTDTIEEMFLLKPEQILTTAGSEMLNWQGTLVPLVRLAPWLRFNCPRQPHALEAAPTINAASVLIVRRGGELIGVQVDRCWGEQEVAIRRVEGTLALPTGFSSCTILGDGRVVPLVNVGELLHWITSCERTAHEQIPPALLPAAFRAITPPMLMPPTQPAVSTDKATVLVVDDSINVRRFLALTLERSGYRVEQAKDGQDALEKLQTGLFVQAVICDIEMPRLDGYGFLAQIKANPLYESLPVAMLTSRSGDKHRQLAMNLGAAAYFSKPYNEQELLRTLERLVTNGALV
ncbi:hybrid sensor histidine kinase/response regulator [Leptolyngbya sp. FACHB-36]|uniref:hybrid sensor histidine kinase/response regulator n=1 Tax=Leptolyngbya sp. FACHB-36 TaxID=2692808 RepID=UPI00167FF550|nr:hybrid sensor histidine kinase/response regulator [Leptolyngbya sp. FACHB-36]MBD2022068.1 hybrid sensor histidine kinase/response regulator [Leptolyngbya sp. FACHB-36]